MGVQLFCRNVIGITAIAAVALGLAGSASAASKKVATKRRVSPPTYTPVAYANSVKDLNCGNVAAHAPKLKGIGPLWEKVASKPEVYSQLMKDEFETTDQWQARQQTIWGLPLGGSDKIVIVNSIDPLHFKYDSDNGLIQIEDIISYNKHYSDDRFHKLMRVFTVVPKWEEYRASNAFGVTVDAARYLAIFGELIFDQELDYPLQKPQYGGWNWVAQVEPAEAKAVKESGKLITVAKPKNPLTRYAVRSDKATIDDPYRSTHRYVGMNVQIECVVLVVGNKEINRIDFMDRSKKESTFSEIAIK